MEKQGKRLMNLTLHQTHHQVADFEAIFTYLKENFDKNSEGLHVFPELFLCGYPLQDLCLQKPFVNSYQIFLTDCKNWIKKNLDPKKCCLLLGGLKYNLTPNGIPLQIENVIYQFGGESLFEPIYTKRLLPNYDIFDEKKYFSKGDKSKVINVFGKNFGVLICEDMWASSFYQIDPVKDLFEYTISRKIDLDGIINLSASPYVLGKREKRQTRAKEISKVFGCPYFYANRVGGEDEILFDGSSFVVNQDSIIEEGAFFLKDVKSLNLDDLPKKYPPKGLKILEESATWEELFQSELISQNKKTIIKPWSDGECEQVFEALKFGVQEYATKSTFSNFTIALSGGIDSALVLTILRLSLKPGQYLEAIYMPSIHSSPLSYDLSLKLCQNLKIPMKTLPIKFLHSTAKNLFQQTYEEPFQGLTDENIQSRLRGTLLYTRSNQINSMVVNTSNKSELAVGYSTQYGDSVGAISMLGDLFKSQVYRLAEYLNKKFDTIIPEEIITRPPTAELRENQVDTESLPPYDRLDAMLEGILNYRYTKQDLVDLGFSQKEVEKTLNMYRRNEYKRFQFCPIIKVGTKSFGFGYRVPMSKKSDFYQN